jgi:hypothetical protein
LSALFVVDKRGLGNLIFARRGDKINVKEVTSNAKNESWLQGNVF